MVEAKNDESEADDEDGHACQGHSHCLEDLLDH
jgi:hypothetical protein